MARSGKGTKRPNYGSGRSQSMRSGYVRLWKPGHQLANRDGYVLEHRYVLHEAGVAIPPGYHVHHLNHDKTDNRLENLGVMSNSEHQRHHRVLGSAIRNGVGTFTVLTPEVRAERNRERCRDYQRRRRHLAGKEHVPCSLCQALPVLVEEVTPA